MDNGSINGSTFAHDKRKLVKIRIKIRMVLATLSFLFFSITKWLLYQATDLIKNDNLTFTNK